MQAEQRRGSWRGACRNGLRCDGDSVEQVPQDIALPEPAITVAREGGAIGHLAVQPKATKPAIGQVEMDFIAQRPFGPDTHAVADN
jgi:hypothetical protein